MHIAKKYLKLFVIVVCFKSLQNFDALWRISTI